MSTVFQTLGALAAHNTGNTVLDVVDPGVPLVDYDATDVTSVQAVWKTQPAVRKVTSFIASNIASIPLHVYKRVDDTDRQRITEGPLSDLLSDPTPRMGAYRFWERAILDMLLYDRCALMVVPAGNEPAQLVRIPPRRFKFVSDGLDRVTAIRVSNGKGETEDLDPERFLFDVGYSQSNGKGLSPITTLSALLKEASEAVAYRRAIMERAAQHSAWVSREAAWPDRNARNNFLESLRAFKRDGGRSGGTVLLDEGMEWHDREFKPTDISDLESRTLTNIEVAGAYHIAPELLGDRPGTYSNMAAHRQALYRDALGPYIAAWEQMVAPLVDMLQPNQKLYIEPFVDAKLRGSFEERASIMQTATGAPWMTRNEARAKDNLPAVPDGDELIVPLNVLVGGQASPTDSGTQNEEPTSEPDHGEEPSDLDSAKPKADPQTRQIKARSLEGNWVKKAEELLSKHYDRQKRAILPALGAKAPQWWDRDRWNRELADDLYALASTCVDQMGADACRQLGFDPSEDWDRDRTLNYLKAVTKARAKWVNDATYRQIKAALGHDPEESSPTPVADVFESAKSQRAAAGAAAFVAAMSSFSAAEAAKQAAPGHTTKTWVTGRNPRPTHLAMNGETVPTGSLFSNGLTWPGDPSRGPDECAGCNCSINIELPLTP